MVLPIVDSFTSSSSVHVVPSPQRHLALRLDTLDSGQLSHR